MAHAQHRGRPAPRRIVASDEFRRWARGLDPDARAHIQAAITHVAAGGPTLGRPHVDVVHGTRLPKLKEARVGRGTRMLFAFDSRRNLVMLAGGDKTGQWNRWYPAKIRLAERLYLDHERRLGKEGRWPTDRTAGRTSLELSR